LITIRCCSQLFEPIQAIIFDKDGTLAQSEPYLVRLAQQRAILINHQVPGIIPSLQKAFGVVSSQIGSDALSPAGLMAVGTRLENEIAAAACVAAMGIPWVRARQLVQAAFQQADLGQGHKVEQTPLIPGATDLIQNLHQLGLKLAILSSDRQIEVEQFVCRFQLSTYFQAVHGVNEPFLEKSDPALLTQIFDQLDVAPNRTLMIGDSTLDAEIARQTGMAGCIGFVGGWLQPVLIDGATVTTKQFSQIEAIL
jgi:phosphoglycolate phosphatase